MPRRGVSVSDCEIARAFKVSGNGIDPVSFIVPRKASCLHASEARYVADEAYDPPTERRFPSRHLPARHFS